MNRSMESYSTAPTATAAVTPLEDSASAAVFYGYEKIEGSSVESGRPCLELVPSHLQSNHSNSNHTSTTTSGMISNQLRVNTNLYPDQSTADMDPSFPSSPTHFDHNSNNNNTSSMGSPLPADRLARKQRNFPRRGGFVHSALLKSAVMASMTEGTTASQLGDFSVLPTAAAGNSSPRKRMRRTDKAIMAPGQDNSLSPQSPQDPQHLSGLVVRTTSLHSHHSLHSGGSSQHSQQQQQQPQSSSSSSDEAVIARATDLLQRLCMQPLDASNSSSTSRRSRLVRNSSRSRNFHHHNSTNVVVNVNVNVNVNNESMDFERKAPVRRVSRRTSYQSQISTGTDFDELDDDEFH